MIFNNYDEYLDFLNDNPEFTGTCVVLHENGQKLYEENLVNGEYHGKQYRWHSNGQKRFEHNFSDGRPCGKQFGWYENSQKEYEYNYVNGKIFGIQMSEGETYEIKPNEKNSIWYIIVKESL